AAQQRAGHDDAAGAGREASGGTQRARRGSVLGRRGPRQCRGSRGAAGARRFKSSLPPSGGAEFASVEEADLREALPILQRRRRPLLAHAEWPAALKPIPAGGDPPTHATWLALRPPRPAGAGPRTHATWLASRPPDAEVDAIAILIALAREFRTHIHIVHLAAAEA